MGKGWKFGWEIVWNFFFPRENWLKKYLDVSGLLFLIGNDAFCGKMMMCLGEKHVIPGWHTSSFPGENHEDVRGKKGAVTVGKSPLGVGNGVQFQGIQAMVWRLKGQTSWKKAAKTPSKNGSFMVPHKFILRVSPEGRTLMRTAAETGECLCFNHLDRGRDQGNLTSCWSVAWAVGSSFTSLVGSTQLNIARPEPCKVVIGLATCQVTGKQGESESWAMCLVQHINIHWHIWIK